MTPLPSLSQPCLHYHVYPGHATITMFIPDMPPLPRISRTCLHYLVYPGHASITLYIPDMTTLPSISRTCLHYLVYPGHDSITLYIPDMPPLLCISRTWLHYLVYSGHASNSNSINVNDSSISQIIYIGGNPATVGQLLEKNSLTKKTFKLNFKKLLRLNNPILH